MGDSVKKYDEMAEEGKFDVKEIEVSKFECLCDDRTNCTSPGCTRRHTLLRPTAELRIVRKTLHKATPGRITAIGFDDRLQQKFVRFDSNSQEPTYVWKNVPIITEDEE